MNMAEKLSFEVLAGEELDRALAKLEGWRRDGEAIAKEFRFGSYMEGVEFARRVAEVAERLNHHPDIHIGYKRVTVSTWTHDKDAITKADLALAGRIDGVA
jgi:4a-hydroxytetrahydrobiopterin dehydratase